MEEFIKKYSFGRSCLGFKWGDEGSKGLRRQTTKRKKDYPKSYKGYTVEEILKTWEEIKSPKGTKANEDLIRVTSQFLRDFRLGIFKKQKQPVKKVRRAKQKGKGIER